MSAPDASSPAVSVPESAGPGPQPASSKNPYYLTPGQYRLLEALQYACNGDSVAAVCRAAGIHRSSYYRWQREPGFCYQMGRVVTRHLAISTQLLLARGVNSALQGDAKVWKTMFGFLTSPGAIQILKANLAELARDAAESGRDCTLAWDRNRLIGPHHQLAREDAAEWRRNRDYARDIGVPDIPSIYDEHPDGQLPELEHLEPYFDPQSGEWMEWCMKDVENWNVPFPVDNDSLPPAKPSVPAPGGEADAVRRPVAQSALAEPPRRQPGFLSQLLRGRRLVSRTLRGLASPPPAAGLTPIRA